MKPIAVHGVGHRTDRHAQDPDFKVIFGLEPKAKWPDAGMESRTMANGTKLWVNAKGDKSRQGVPRLMAMCGKCNKIMGAGRIQQHFEVCAR